MSRKVGRRDPPGCGGKVQYATWDDAEATALRLAESDEGRATHPGAVQTYKCCHCGAWHLGHWNKNRTPLETAKMVGLTS